MFRLLTETCVWLDYAKDYRPAAAPDGADELLRDEGAVLILPDGLRGVRVQLGYGV